MTLIFCVHKIIGKIRFYDILPLQYMNCIWNNLLFQHTVCIHAYICRPTIFIHTHKYLAIGMSLECTVSFKFWGWDQYKAFNNQKTAFPQRSGYRQLSSISISCTFCLSRYTYNFSTGFLKWLTTPWNSSSQPRWSLSIYTPIYMLCFIDCKW